MLHHKYRHRIRLVNFYTRNNPSKLGEVDSLLANFRGREEEMFAALEKKYARQPQRQPQTYIEQQSTGGNQAQQYGRPSITVNPPIHAPMPTSSFSPIHTSARRKSSISSAGSETARRGSFVELDENEEESRVAELANARRGSFVELDDSEVEEVSQQSKVWQQKQSEQLRRQQMRKLEQEYQVLQVKSDMAKAEQVSHLMIIQKRDAEVAEKLKRVIRAFRHRQTLDQRDESELSKIQRGQTELEVATRGLEEQVGGVLILHKQTCSSILHTQTTCSINK